MAKKIQKETVEVEVIRIERGELEFCILGTSPLICNRYSEKAKHELLMPGKTDKSMLKHNPLMEFRGAPYCLPNGSETLLAMPSTAFKGAMMTAALDMPDVTKSAIGRQVYVLGEYIGIYGIPKLHMTMVRSAGMNRTPDVRTRVIVPKWAAIVRVQFAMPIMRAKSVTNLMAAAGIISGVGDFRNEKGKGTFGQFMLASATDPAFKAIVKTGTRAPQIAAMNAADPYNEETEELLTWFTGEAKARGWEFDAVGNATKPKKDEDAGATTTKKRGLKSA